MAEECTHSIKEHTKLDIQLSPGKCSKKTQRVTQHNYLTKMANEIIDEYTGVAIE